MSSTSGNAQEPRWLSEAIADVVVTAVAGEWGAAGSRHGRIHRPTEASAAAGLARRPGFVDRLSRLVDPAVRGSLTLGHQLVESWKAPGSPEPGHVRRAGR